MKRVFSRIVNKKESKINFDQFIEINKKKLFNSKRNSDFVEALMEFGALVCKPKDPKCGICNLNKACNGDWIFQIDADEIPNEILLKQLPEILEINDTDLVWVPRINIVNGITSWHLHHWHWRQTEQGWINFPDYQARIFRNVDHINWVKPVHEIIEGAKTYSHLPPQEELTLKHEKDIVRQEQQNRLYDTII